MNPCTGAADTVNVSGTLHIVYYTRYDGSGGYHVDQTTDEQAKGLSLVTSVSYLLSDNYDSSWQTSTGSTYTQTHDTLLVSQSNTPNFLLRVTYHTTVTPGGVPAAAVDSTTVACAG